MLVAVYALFWYSVSKWSVFASILSTGQYIVTDCQYILDKLIWGCNSYVWIFTVFIRKFSQSSDIPVRISCLILKNSQDLSLSLAGFSTLKFVHGYIYYLSWLFVLYLYTDCNGWEWMDFYMWRNRGGSSETQRPRLMIRKSVDR